MEAMGLLCGGIAVVTSTVAVMVALGAWVTLLERLRGLATELKRLQGRLAELESTPRVEAGPAEAGEVPPLARPTASDASDPVRAEPSDEAEPGGARGAEPSGDAVPVEPREPEPPGTPAEEPRVERPPAKPAFQWPSPERIAVFLAAGIGGLALLLGGLFALVAILESGLLLPSIRVCLGLIGGTFVWVVGAVLRGRVRGVPSALEGAGMGLSFGALFAAHGFYGMLGPGSAFALMAAISAVAALRAAVHRDRFMAWLGLLGGLLSPVLVSTGDNGAVGLFSYLFLMLLGTVGIAGWRRWPDLVVGSALGAGGLYFGWTVSWYGVDSVWIALLAAFALQVPFAATAALVGEREGESRALRIGLVLTAVLGAALFPVLALPWVYALDATFTDPRSGLTIVQQSGPTRLFGAIALSALPIPLWMAGRIRRQVAISAIPSAAVGVLTLFWSGSWAYAQGVDPLMLAACIAPLAVGLFLHLGERRTGAALLLLLPAIGLVLAVTPAPDLGITGAQYAAAVVCVVLLAAVGAYVAAPGSLAGAAVLVLGFSLAVAASLSEDLGAAWVLGATLVALGGLSAPSLFRRWSTDRFPSLPWLGALLAGPAVFPALYVLWEAELGVGAIGLLPTLLGLHGLLTAVVLVRGYAVRRDSPLLALAVAVSMLGVTFALPVQFQEEWLTVGWALEGLALAVLALGVKHPLLRWGSVFLGITIGVRLLVNPYALAYGDTTGWPILNWTLYTWGVPTLTLVASGFFVARTAPEGRRDLLGWAPLTLGVLAMLTGFALVNVQVSHMFQDAGPVELGGTTMLQGMVRSLAWAGWGTFLLLTGIGVRSRTTRFVGFAFLLLAAAKVFVYDIWSLPGFVRVGSFMGLGVLLIFSALLFDRIVMRPDAPEPEEA